MDEVTRLVVHSGEIALKGKRRSWFEKKLSSNLKKAFGGQEVNVRRISGRVVLEISEKFPTDTIQRILCRVPGVSWFSLTEACSSSIESIEEAVLRVAEGKIEGRTFKVKTVRAYKQFPYSSPEVDRRLGRILEEKYGSRVSLREPDVIFTVEITKDEAFIHTDKIRGPGGLPIGSEGRTLVLLSGGIDSSVAAFLMMKRGCVTDALHLHTYPSNEDVKTSKLVRLLQAVKPYPPKIRLYVAPYHMFDVEVIGKVPSEYSLIIFRRFLVKVAERLASKINSAAIVTGDNLGQVASQTLENMSACDDAVRIPILRPLLAYDKEEIIDSAKKIGTYDISIEPYKDCCSIISKHPALSPRLEDVIFYESTAKIDALTERFIPQIQRIEY